MRSKLLALVAAQILVCIISSACSSANHRDVAEAGTHEPVSKQMFLHELSLQSIELALCHVKANRVDVRISKPGRVALWSESLGDIVYTFEDGRLSKVELNLKMDLDKQQAKTAAAVLGNARAWLREHAEPLEWGTGTKGPETWKILGGQSGETWVTVFVDDERQVSGLTIRMAGNDTTTKRASGRRLHGGRSEQLDELAQIIGVAMPLGVTPSVLCEELRKRQLSVSNIHVVKMEVRVGSGNRVVLIDLSVGAYLQGRVEYIQGNCDKEDLLAMEELYIDLSKSGKVVRDVRGSAEWNLKVSVDCSATGKGSQRELKAVLQRRTPKLEFHCGTPIIPASDPSSRAAGPS